MDVAVVGSYQSAKEAENAPSFAIFEEACVAIGRALGEGNHRLSVAHRKNPDGTPSKSAEALALRGFLNTVGRDHYGEVPHHIGDPELKAHTEAVERSDAVTLIGAKESTY